MSNLPVVSAIIPCHNHENWVVPALISIVKQNYTPLRLIFIDDGSTDNSWDNVLKLCKDVRPIDLSTTTEPAQLISANFSSVPILLARFSRSYGPSCARNYGIRSVIDNTDLFAFLDSDDEYKEWKLQKSIDIFTENQFCGIVYSDYTTENVHSGVTQRQFKYPYSKQLLFQGECLANMDSVFSSEVFKDVGLFDESMRCCEDLDMYVRAADKFLLCHIPEDLIKIRVHNKSSTGSISKEIWNQNYGRVFSKLKQRQDSKS